MKEQKYHFFIIKSYFIKNFKLKVSKLFKEAYYQLSNIKELLSMFNLKFSVVLTLSLVLPSSAHPFAYDGLVYKLLFKKKMKKNLNAYDILAYGGRYDRLVSFFRVFISNSALKMFFPCGHQVQCCCHYLELIFYFNCTFR